MADPPPKASHSLTFNWRAASPETIFGLQDHKNRVSAKEQDTGSQCRVHQVLTSTDKSVIETSFPQPPSQRSADLFLAYIHFPSSVLWYGQHSPSWKDFSWSSSSCPLTPSLSLFQPRGGSLKHHTAILWRQNKPVPIFTESQNHSMVAVRSDLCGHPVQPLCRSRVTYSRLHRTLSRRVLNISREGDSTTPLGSLCQCSITLRGKKFFLMFRQNFLCFSLCL